MKESVNLHIEEVYFIRQKWAASVIANVLRKNCEFRKRERMKREQIEKERKRKLEEERKRKMEEEEKNRGTEEQLGKDKEKTAEVETMFLIQHYRKQKGVDPGIGMYGVITISVCLGMSFLLRFFVCPS